MKIKFAFLLAAMTMCVFIAQAQNGNRRQRTVEERVQMVHQKIDSAFKLDAAKLTQTDSAFAKYYRATDKLRADMMSAGGDRPDFQAMRDKMQPLTDARDTELKGIMTADQFKKWKDEVEPSMQPRRRQQ